MAGAETAARNFLSLSLSLSRKLADNTGQVIFYSLLQLKQEDGPTTGRATPPEEQGNSCGAEPRAATPGALPWGKYTEKTGKKQEGHNQPDFEGISLQPPRPQASPRTRHFLPRCDIYSNRSRQSVFKRGFFHSCSRITNIFKLGFHDGCCTVRWEMPPGRTRGE